MSSQLVGVGDFIPRKIGTSVVTGTNTNPATYDSIRQQFTFYYNPSGTVTTCSLQVQASPDGGTTWFNVGSADTTTTAHVTTVTVSANCVRVAVTVVGGGNFTVWVAAV